MIHCALDELSEICLLVIDGDGLDAAGAAGCLAYLYHARQVHLGCVNKDSFCMMPWAGSLWNQEWQGQP